MATTTLSGISVSDIYTYGSSSSFTVTTQSEGVISYEISSPENNLNYGTNIFGIPEIYVGNSTDALISIGGNPNDEV